MKIALFSDIHGNLTGLKAVLAFLDAEGGSDVTFALGDLIGGGPATDEVIDLLVARGVRMVLGDSDTEDKWLGLIREATDAPGTTRSTAAHYRATLDWLRASLSPQGRAFLDALPLSDTLEVAPGKRLYVCHASPRGPHDRVCGPENTAATLRAAYGDIDADVIVFGHLHTPFVRLFDGRLFVNIGSVAFRPDSTSIRDAADLSRRAVDRGAARRSLRRSRGGTADDRARSPGRVGGSPSGLRGRRQRKLITDSLHGLLDAQVGSVQPPAQARRLFAQHAVEGEHGVWVRVARFGARGDAGERPVRSRCFEPQS